MPAGRNGCVSSPNGRYGFATCRLRPYSGGTQPPPELIGQVGELAAELEVGWTGESYPPPGVALEAVRQSSPRQESVETVNVTKDRVPLRRSGAPAKKRRGAVAQPAGAVDLLRMDVASLRVGDERAPKTPRWLCRTVTERCLDCSAAKLLEAEMRRRRPRQRRHDHCRECSVSGSE